MSAADRLPASPESERAVLAALLLDPELLATAAARLAPDDFHQPRHRLIHAAALALQAAGVTPDIRTLQAHLEERGQLAKVGGVAYLHSLDLALPDLGRTASYVEIVRERALRRRLIAAAGDLARRARDGERPATDALAAGTRALVELGRQAVRSDFVDFADAVGTTLEEIEERPAGRLTGLPTGFPDLDRLTHGLQPGNLILLAGRPGMGKTALALNIAQHVALRERRRAAVVSLEMSRQELVLRVLASEARIPFTQLREGRLSQRQWSALVALLRRHSDAPLSLDDGVAATVTEVAAKARRLDAQDASLALLVVDYLQLLRPDGRHQNRNLEIGALSRALKELAKELHIPILALSQLSREVERRTGDRRPRLADLRESGNLEQDADLVAFIYRDEVYNPGNPETAGTAELILAKHRNGAPGTVHLAWHGPTTTFRSLAAGEE